MDDFARLNLAEFRRAIKAGEEYTIPWLDLDIEAYRAYRQGTADVLPKPYCDDPADRMMMEQVQGLRVLCLAGGGGQQSAVYSLLGASVTVFDLTPEQLEADQAAARHYGYQVTTTFLSFHLAASPGWISPSRPSASPTCARSMLAWRGC
jgi:2-polyprenyl-3-methyl-5-hydroxy-6-metoxy-1,4-benzoquinol methylase